MKKTVSVVAIGTGYTKDWINDRYTHINRLYYINGGSGGYKSKDGYHPFLKGHLYYLPWCSDFSLYQNDDDPLDHTYANFILNDVGISHAIPDIDPQKNEVMKVLTDAFTSLVKSLSKEHHPGFSFVHYEEDLHYPCSEVFEALICEIIERSTPHESTKSNVSEDIANVIRYINEHYKEKLTLEKLASIAFLHKRYLIGKFKKEVGCTPYQYIQRLRCHAISVLKSQGMSEKRASEEVGFAYSSSYYRIKNNEK